MNKMIVGLIVGTILVTSASADYESYEYKQKKCTETMQSLAFLDGVAKGEENAAIFMSRALLPRLRHYCADIDEGKNRMIRILEVEANKTLKETPQVRRVRALMSL